MSKILLFTDGSEQGLRALPHVIRLYQTHGPFERRLLNVQIPIQSGHARIFVSQEELEAYYQEERERAGRGLPAA